MRKNMFVVTLALIASISCNVLCMKSKQINVVKTSKLMDTVQYIDENTFVLLDLDGTLWRPSKEKKKIVLGNNAWAYYEGDKYIYEYKKLGYKDYVKRGLAAFWPTWVHVQNKVDMEFIDPDTEKFLKFLKDKNVPTIGFTARGMELADRTKVQMDKLGIKFNAPEFSVTKSSPFIFKHDVLFVGIGVDKGKCLFDFFEQNNWKKQKILFIDDMEKNIKSVLKFCEKNKVPCLPVWFQGDPMLLTEKEKRIGDFQLGCLEENKVVLSNKEAELGYVNVHYEEYDLKQKKA